MSLRDFYYQGKEKFFADRTKEAATIFRQYEAELREFARELLHELAPEAQLQGWKDWPKWFDEHAPLFINGGLNIVGNSLTEKELNELWLHPIFQELLAHVANKDQGHYEAGRMAVKEVETMSGGVLATKSARHAMEQHVGMVVGHEAVSPRELCQRLTREHPFIGEFLTPVDSLAWEDRVGRLADIVSNEAVMHELPGVLGSDLARELLHRAIEGLVDAPLKQILQGAPADIPYHREQAQRLHRYLTDPAALQEERWEYEEASEKRKEVYRQYEEGLALLTACAQAEKLPAPHNDVQAKMYRLVAALPEADRRRLAQTITLKDLQDVYRTMRERWEHARITATPAELVRLSNGQQWQAYTNFIESLYDVLKLPLLAHGLQRASGEVHDRFKGNQYLRTIRAEVLTNALWQLEEMGRLSFEEYLTRSRRSEQREYERFQKLSDLGAKYEAITAVPEKHLAFMLVQIQKVFGLGGGWADHLLKQIRSEKKRRDNLQKK